MRVCAIQPPYGYDQEDAQKTVQFIIDELDSCQEDLDLILTPEYSNTPGSIPPEQTLCFAEKWRAKLENSAIAAAKRCNAVVALSYSARTNEDLERNTTRLFLPSGEIAGEYWKQQLVLTEPAEHKVDNSYALTPRSPTVIEINGLRFAFVICYDAYFFEYIETLAACQPDIVLVSAMQRAETFENLRLLNRMLAFRTNAFVLRSSYSMGENTCVGGTSLVVDPAGKILSDMGCRTGKLVCDIADPKWKYMRSNSFGGNMIRNDRFIEQGRTPWAYRPSGPFVCMDDKHMKYPRICAHHGFHTMLPQNTLPAFGAAIALGADEIGFDIQETADGIPVIIHDAVLEHVSDGTGIVREKSYAELLELDFGSKCGKSLRGLKIITLEDILQKFARHAVMNIHIKSFENGRFSRPFIRKIADLLHQYDCAEYAFFTGSSAIQEAAVEAAPEISRCMYAESDTTGDTILKQALYWKCQKLQFFKPHFTQDMIAEAHRHGLICNFFWSDDQEEAEKLLEAGIDTILTNNCLQIAQVRDKFIRSKTV